MQKENLREIALAYCEKDKLSRIDVAECIKGQGEILYADECAVFVEHMPSGILMLDADDEDGAERALQAIQKATRSSGERWLVAREGAARECVYKKFPVSRETECFQVAYVSKEPLRVQGELVFCLAKRAEIEVIKQNYGLEPPENIEKLFLEQKIFCGFDKDGTFIGFIGSHPEGSMGMLHIFPEYRRKGYAEEIEKRLANVYIQSGRVPYGHVIVDNLPSLALQKKLGLEVAEQKIYWLRIE